MFDSLDTNIINQKMCSSDSGDFLKMNSFTTLYNDAQQKTKAKPFWWINGAGNDENDLFTQNLLSVEALSEAISVLKVIPLSEEAFKSRHRESLFRLIKSTRFISGEDNLASEKFAEMLTENKDVTLFLLQEYFVSEISKSNVDESLLVKFLTLLNDYDYDYLYPISQMIALSALSLTSVKVKSASFNLLGHWGNDKTLNLLKNVGGPNEPWLKMKYNALIRIIESNALRT